MDLNVVDYSVNDAVALVTLNRPDRLNSWTTRMAHEVRWCVRSANTDPDVRVIVLTGAGRGFCAGADMGALRGLAGGQDYELMDGVEDQPQGTFSYLLDLDKPVIAAVNGPAAGVGFVLMCFADIRFVAEGAKITTSFGRLGLPAEHGVSWVLPRIVGAGRAADLLFSSRVILGQEAFEMGLANQVLPAESLLEFSLDYARGIATGIAPSSLQAMKRQLWGDVGGSLDEAWQHADQQMLGMIASPEFAEGVAAYNDKRPPRFPPVSNR